MGPPANLAFQTSHPLYPPRELMTRRSRLGPFRAPDPADRAPDAGPAEPAAFKARTVIWRQPQSNSKGMSMNTSKPQRMMLATALVTILAATSAFAADGDKSKIKGLITAV